MNHLRKAAMEERLAAMPRRVGSPLNYHTVTSASHGHLSELGPVFVDRKLADAREQLAYWTMRKGQAERERDRIEAAARITLWKGEVAACERRVRELNRRSDPRL